MNERWKGRGKSLGQALKRYQMVLLVLVVGLVFLAMPSGSKQDLPEPSDTAADGSFDLEALEEKYSKALSEIDGAGSVTVVLTVGTGSQQILAEDGRYSHGDNRLEEESATVILSRGSGLQETVTIQEVYPQFQGALVISDGGEHPDVRLKLMEATAALTGLGTDKISICSRGK